MLCGGKRLLCTLSSEGEQLVDYQAGQRRQLQPGQSFWHLFVIPDQSAEPARPAKTALDYPAPGQLREPAFGLRLLHDVDLALLPSFGPVIPSPVPTLRGGLQRAAIDDNGGRLIFPSL